MVYMNIRFIIFLTIDILLLDDNIFVNEGIIYMCLPTLLLLYISLDDLLIMNLFCLLLLIFDIIDLLFI